MRGWSPGSRVKAFQRLPNLLVSDICWALTAYSRGGGCGFGPLFGSPTPHSHFTQGRFAPL